MFYYPTFSWQYYFLLLVLNCAQGFVIVSALLVTALLQFIFDGKPPSPYCLVALPLVMISISVYQKYPYRVKKKQMWILNTPYYDFVNVCQHLAKCTTSTHLTGKECLALIGTFRGVQLYLRTGTFEWKSVALLVDISAFDLYGYHQHDSAFSI